MNASGVSDLDTLREIVKTAAARELLPRFTRIYQQIKADGSIVTEADHAMQQALHTALQARWPQIAFLGEEMPATQQEHILQESQHGVWIVDPLDGTSNFSVGIPCFAVSVALICQGRLELGLVYDPVRDECFSAQRDHGARLNDTRLDLAALREVSDITIGLVDFKRLTPELATKLAISPPFKSQRSFGSVALDWCWIAAGRGDVYVHGKQKLWDYAAGQLILSEAGGFAATLQGEPVYNGTLTPRSAVLAINQVLFDKWWHSLQI
jgi:myo-inositol-1(or 4)-monophosphatase